MPDAASGVHGVHEAAVAVIESIAAELAAVVGGHLYQAQVDATLLKMLERPFCGEGCVVHGGFGSIVEELSAGGAVAYGELIAGKAELVHKTAIVRDVGEVLGVHLQIRKWRQGKLFGTPVGSFSVRLSSLFLAQGVLSDNSGDSPDAGVDFEFVFEAPGGEVRLAANSDDLSLGIRMRFVGTVLGSSRLLNKAGLAFFLEAPQPFSDGVATGGESSLRRADAVPAGVEHHLKTQCKLMIFRAYHVIICHRWLLSAWMLSDTSSSAVWSHLFCASTFPQVSNSG